MFTIHYHYFLITPHILDSSENDTKNNISIDNDATNVDAEFHGDNKQNLQTEYYPSVSDSAINSVLEVGDNLDQEGPPLNLVINMLPPTGEVIYNALPSFASLLSIIEFFASSYSINTKNNQT